MSSPILIVTAVYSLVGACLNAVIVYLVLSRGKRAYHLLFAGFIFICLMWDAGVFLEMLRNGHLDELPVYGYVISLPCVLMPALMLHFALSYTGRRSAKLVGLVWAAVAVSFLLAAAGLMMKIEGTYSYPWGNIHRVGAQSFLDFAFVPLLYGGNLLACWFLYRHWLRTPPGLQRRHTAYILAGFLTISLATAKIVVVMGVDAALLLPLGMALTDLCAALIGVAIVKDRLLDITVVVKKGVIYSTLAAGAVFLFSLSEHILATYVGERLGEDSATHLLSAAVVVALAMPVKQRLERAIEAVFARRLVHL